MQTHVEIRFIPLPPEKRAAWNRSMQIITRHLIEIIKEKQKNLPQPTASGPGKRQEQIQTVQTHK